MQMPAASESFHSKLAQSAHAGGDDPEKAKKRSQERLWTPSRRLTYPERNDAVRVLLGDSVHLGGLPGYVAQDTVAYDEV
ncbi:hypothetical protein VTN00DRAFT_954 [Thermoascus crustaceus]|uniref:uncharacterized protein n=1 Tax=Thermoascus crustaceus TaxID=5088 RepID=UPI0037436BA0